MNPIFIGVIFAVTLAVGILLLLEIGRRAGARQLAEGGEAAIKGFGAIESAIFALLGLILAFSFSGALARFDARRQLIVTEENDIGTAWLRIDLLPPEAQPPLRELFRRYLDSRIATYRMMPDLDAALGELERSAKLRGEIWTAAVNSSRQAQGTQATMLLLPALNAMFDTASSRTESARMHSPPVIFVLLGTLTLACSLFAGYDMAHQPRLNLLHSVAFAAVLAVTVYVIIDLEYPRLGLIRISGFDKALVDLRKGMN